MYGITAKMSHDKDSSSSIHQSVLSSISFIYLSIDHPSSIIHPSIHLSISNVSINQLIDTSKSAMEVPPTQIYKVSNHRRRETAEVRTSHRRMYPFMTSSLLRCDVIHVANGVIFLYPHFLVSGFAFVPTKAL